MNKRTQPLRPALFIIIICVVVIGGIMLLLFRSTHSDVQQQPQRQTPLRAPTPTRAPHITYTSHKLGISFTYATMVSGVQNFFTKEIGNTVYLYTNVNTGSVNQPFSGTDAEFLRTVAPGAKYVEVFSKEPAESLTNTLKTKFLQGYSPNNCPILPTTLAKSSERL